MQHVSRRTAFFTLAVLISLLASALLPASAALASPVMQSETAADEEIILLGSDGVIHIEDPHAQAGVVSGAWTSPDAGWQNLATGDLNGDGDQEVIAIRNSQLKVFDTVVQPARPQVFFESNLEASRPWRLLAAGDFDGDGRDEIAATAKDPDANTETLHVYDGGANGTAWTELKSSPLGDQYRLLRTGNINGDKGAGGADVDELLLTRGASIRIYFGPGLSDTSRFDKNYNSSLPWLNMAVDDLATDAALPGEELVLTRSDAGAALPSTLYFRWSGNDLVDLIGGVIHNPPFSSIATGDVNGDQDAEVMLLRDPGADLVSILMQNPVGAPVGPFQGAIGYSSDAWVNIKMGDLDADGRDETVIIRGSTYRIYEDSVQGYGSTEANVGYALNTVRVANVNSALFIVPRLSVSPSPLALQGNYGTVVKGSLSISNTGLQIPMNWTAQVLGTDGTWLKVNNGTSAAGAAPATLAVTADTVAANHLGIVVGTIRVTASAAGWAGATQDIVVNLNTLDPGLVVKPLSILLMGGQTTGSVSSRLLLSKPSPGAWTWVATAVPTESLGDAVSWLASGDVRLTAEGLEGAPMAFPAPTWLTLTPSQGTIQGNQLVTVTADASATTIGTHEATVLIVAEDSAQKKYVQWVSVTLIAKQSVTQSFAPALFR